MSIPEPVAPQPDEPDRPTCNETPEGPGQEPDGGRVPPMIIED